MPGTNPTAAEIKQHITNFYGDTSRPVRDTRQGLEEISDLIDMYLEGLHDKE